MSASERRREYWRKSLTITALVLFAWAVLTFLIGYYAREVHDVATVLYAVVVVLYAWYMAKQNRSYLNVPEGRISASRRDGRAV